jgi:1-acyl-sn-glycerol-3-phosphate acyltransferase
MQTPIKKYSFTYASLRKYVVFFLRRFYRISVSGADNIHPDDRLIIVANHQNALMDALVLLSLNNFQPVFMARSDVFTNKGVAKILRVFKMLPIYRIRDGYDQLANNREVFQEAFEVLQKGIPVIIFPEGNHDDRFRLRAMKKGAARIAFSYRHHDPVKREIKILPVGLNYSDVHMAGSRLFVNIGKPVDVAEFDHEFEENQAKGSIFLLKKVSDSLKENILHIEDEEAYSTIYTLVQIFGSFGHSENQKHKKIHDSQRKIVEFMENWWNGENRNDFLKVKEMTDEIAAQLTAQELSISDIPLVKEGKNSRQLLQVLLVSISPLWLYGRIVNYLPSLVLNKIKGKIKDAQFKSSVQFTGTILIFPVIYILMTVIFAVFSPPMYWTLLFFISLPVSYVVMIRWEQLKEKIAKINRMETIKSTLIHILRNLQQLTNISFYFKS